VTTLTIPEARLGEFQKRVGRLGRKARKLGVDAPEVLVVDRVYLPCPEDARKIEEGEPASKFPHYAHRVLEVSNVESIRVEGFRLLAKVEPSPVQGINLIHTAPGADGDSFSEFRRCAMLCHHCNTIRQRKQTFVVEDRETHQRFLIGRNCLADFIGTPDADRLADFYDSCIEDLREPSDWAAGYGAPVCMLVEYIEMTAACIDEFGWLSRGAARDRGEPATADVVHDAIMHQGQFKRSAYNRTPTPVPTITEEHRASAAAAIDWIRSTSPDPATVTNEYTLNLRLVCDGEFFDLERLGLVCSLLVAHRRYLSGEELRVRQEKEKAEAAPVPVTDVRVEVRGQVVGAKWRSTDFGETLKIVVQHDDGWKVWGTCPKAFGSDESKIVGRTIQFVARIEPSSDDATFGFFSRPTKPEILAVDGAEDARG
jgi:hypothetical protein